MMSRVKKGLVAGIFATIAASLLEIPNMFLGWFDPLPMVIVNVLGMGGNAALGWAIHLFAGVFILGPLFGMLYPRLPTDTPETKGIAFAVSAWVLMMGGIVLFGNYATFSASAGFGTFGWLLLTHAVYGIVLGNVFVRLVKREKRANAAFAGGAPAH